MSPFITSAIVALRLLAATAASSRPAMAPAARASLDVQRAPEAAGCPDAVGLAADLAAITGVPDRFVASPGAPVRVAVAWNRLPTGEFRAILRLDGARQGTRTLSDAGPTCAALGHAVAVALVLVLDGDPPATSDADENATAAAEPGPPPARTSDAASGPSGRAGTTSHLALLAGPSGGQVARLSGAGRLELGARLRRASVVVGVERVLSRTSAIAPGTVEISLWAGRLSLCALLTDPSRWVQLDACAVGSVGALRGRGQGFPLSSASTLTWWAAGGEVRAIAVFRRRWLVALAADVAATLYQYTFSIAEVGAVRGSDRWTGQLLAGAGVKLW